jgi:hypothetical protein
MDFFGESYCLAKHSRENSNTCLATYVGEADSLVVLLDTVPVLHQLGLHVTLHRTGFGFDYSRVWTGQVDAEHLDQGHYTDDELVFFNPMHKAFVLTYSSSEIF